MDLDFWDSLSYDFYNLLAYLLIHGEDATTHTEDSGDSDASMIIRLKLPDGYVHIASFSALTSDKPRNIIRGN